MPHSITNSQTGGYFTLLGKEQLIKSFKKVSDVAHYTILWNRAGKADLLIDSIPTQLNAHEAITLSGNQKLQLLGFEDLVAVQYNREFYCIVDHDKEVSCVGLIFYGVTNNPVINLGESYKKHESLMQVFYDELATKDSIQEEMVRMLLKRLIIMLTRLYKDQYFKERSEQSEETDLIRNFNLLVEIHYKKSHQVAFYADLMHKSPKTLSNTFRKLYNKSPLNIIHQRLALESKRLLLYTDKTAKEIGFEIGFQEEAHFSRFFKKMEGITPLKFRKAE